MREQELTRIGDWLPGSYDNSAQVDEDLRRADGETHPALEMTIAPVAAPFIGDLVVYAEQAETRGPRQVVSQQLYLFDKSADEKAVVQRVFEFKDGRRWRRALEHPEMFKGLLTDDITATPACDLVWKFEGETFTGKAGRKGCGIREMSFDGLELNVEQAGRPQGDVIRFRRVGAD